MTAWRFLFLSICLHLVIWFFVLNRTTLKKPEENKAVEVTLYEKDVTKPDHQRIVRQALPTLDMLKPEPPKHPKFLSENDQSVKKEMHARQPGLTQNRQTTVSQNAAENAQQSSGQKSEDSDDVGIGPKKSGDNSQGNDSRLRNLGHRLFSMSSTSGEYLPDVSDGPITALNTERFVYYSFFSRIEERIRPLWERNIQETHRQLPMQIQKQLTQHDWVTGIEVLLDSKGNYLTTLVLQSSGVTEIDQDSVSAFRDAAIFPNPPKGMIQEDGKIHLKYAFIVQETPDSVWARQ